VGDDVGGLVGEWQNAEASARAVVPLKGLEAEIETPHRVVPRWLVLVFG
jgi:hypothetical protein